MALKPLSVARLSPASATLAQAVGDGLRYHVQAGTLPMDRPGAWVDVAHVRRAFDRAGSHWFDPSAMAFFGARLPRQSSPLIFGRFFITGEQPPHGTRGYTIRLALGGPNSSPRMETLGPVAAFASRAAAERVLRAVLAGWGVA